jgi:ribonucleoside-diphosphate reductase alpha chain
MSNNNEYNEAFRQCVEYFGGDDLAANVFLTKYALTDKDGNIQEKTPDDMHRRLASEFFRIEQKYPNSMSEDDIYNLFANFKYVVPQGSPMSGIGNPHQIQSISNCFVIDSPHDSYGGILKTDQELVQIAKRRGGVGFDISSIRPKGENTGNCARTTDGIEVFMDRYSNSCREVAQGGRRGALMITISVLHPQVRDFIRIKRNLTRITGANLSVRLTDSFMHAVRDETEFKLQWPVDSSEPVVTSTIDAKDLWHEIIESAHACAEPGLLFWDNAKTMTPSDIYEDEGFGSVSTNPCGEIILSPYDSCRLMLVNLKSFVLSPFTPSATFDYEKMGEVVQKAQRLMDDMIDLEIEQVDKILQKIIDDPEPDSVKRTEREMWESIKSQALRGRRTGLGVTAVGDAVAALGIRYGSEESIRTVETIYKCLSLNSYKSSCILAEERGSFPVYNKDKEEGHPYLSRLFAADEELAALHAKSGRRNIALTTTAPAGSVSVLTQTTSGIEPAFLLKYMRRKKINAEAEPNARIDFVDDIGDAWQEYPVYHHAYREWMETTGLQDEKMSPYWKATANEIVWTQKVKMQAAAQNWICHAISNTTNLPEDTSIETVKDVYMTGWQLGCKGVTVYRDGCRSGVLVGETSRTEGSFEERSSPKRTETLECDIHIATIKGERWTILVGIMNGRPYEVMGGLSHYVEIPRKYKTGTIAKKLRKTTASIYDLTVGEGDDLLVVKDIVKVFDNPNYAGYTRTISLALRHGAPIQYLVEQLQKDKDADLFSFSKVIARCLKKYIADGTKSGSKVCEACDTENSLIYQEGCVTCANCGHSKCS